MIENGDAVEEQDILRIERQPAAKPLRLHIADIDQCDLRIGAGQKRRKAACKRIAEDHKLAVRIRTGVRDREQGF